MKLKVKLYFNYYFISQTRPNPGTNGRVGIVCCIPNANFQALAKVAK